MSFNTNSVVLYRWVFWKALWHQLCGRSFLQEALRRASNVNKGFKYELTFMLNRMENAPSARRTCIALSIVTVARHAKYADSEVFVGSRFCLITTVLCSLFLWISKLQKTFECSFSLRFSPLCTFHRYLLASALPALWAVLAGKRHWCITGWYSLIYWILLYFTVSSHFCKNFLCESSCEMLI